MANFTEKCKIMADFGRFSFSVFLVFAAPPEIHKTIFIMHLARFSEAVLGADEKLLLILSQ